MPRNAAQSPNEKIEYVATMLRELRGIAEEQNCDMLVYLIGMAEVEAGDVARGTRSNRMPQGEPTKPEEAATDSARRGGRTAR